MDYGTFAGVGALLRYDIGNLESYEKAQTDYKGIQK